jgi:hypothetical protein
MDHYPPIPTLYPSNRPLHDLLGFAPSRNVVVMTLRDPSDARDMPANSNEAVNATCIRGVKKVQHILLDDVIRD